MAPSDRSLDVFLAKDDCKRERQNTTQDTQLLRRRQSRNYGPSNLLQQMERLGVRDVSLSARRRSYGMPASSHTPSKPSPKDSGPHSSRHRHDRTSLYDVEVYQEEIILFAGVTHRRNTNALADHRPRRQPTQLSHPPSSSRWNDSTAHGAHNAEGLRRSRTYYGHPRRRPSYSANRDGLERDPYIGSSLRRALSHSHSHGHRNYRNGPDPVS